jgi:hypothetical protein
MEFKKNSLFDFIISNYLGKNFVTLYINYYLKNFGKYLKIEHNKRNSESYSANFIFFYELLEVQKQ